MLPGKPQQFGCARVFPSFTRPRSHPESAAALCPPPLRPAALYPATPVTNLLRTQRSAGTRAAGQFHIRESSRATSDIALRARRELHESSPVARLYRPAHRLRHAPGCADDTAAPRAPLPHSSSPSRSTRRLRHHCLLTSSLLRSLVPCRGPRRQVHVAGVAWSLPQLSVCTSTDSTAGRSRTIGAQLSPPSAEP
jgi:hypothetical protein